MGEKLNWEQIEQALEDSIDFERDNDIQEEMRQYDEVFSKMKEIGKELLF